MVLTIKPVSSACNMRCSYCYYVDKFSGGERLRMTEETLETTIRKYAEAMPEGSTLAFLWHGGEPLLMPRGFYEKAIRLQQQYARGRTITNSLQTNGTLITPEWGRFFAREGWLLGVSIDGGAPLNDANRTLPDGRSSSDVILRAISHLNDAGAEWNAMATVNSVNVGHPEEFYDFMKGLGTRFIQFTPILESITPAQWGDFLCRVFDRWVAGDIGKIYVQMFDATLAGYLGANPATCIFSPLCGLNPVVEANGDIYSCDHFVFDTHRIGNIHTDDLTSLFRPMEEFGAAKQAALPQECKECRFLNLCNGECPKNRIATDSEGRKRNYFCEGYRRYFTHSEGLMRRAADGILRSIR